MSKGGPPITIAIVCSKWTLPSGYKSPKSQTFWISLIKKKLTKRIDASMIQNFVGYVSLYIRLLFQSGGLLLLGIASFPYHGWAQSVLWQNENVRQHSPKYSTQGNGLGSFELETGFSSAECSFDRNRLCQAVTAGVWTPFGCKNRECVWSEDSVFLELPDWSGLIWRCRLFFYKASHKLAVYTANFCRKAEA